MPSTDLLLTFNAGSSTVKIGIFAIEDANVRRIGKGMIDFRAEPLTFSITEGPQISDTPLEAEFTDDLRPVVDEVCELLSEHFDIGAVRAAGHRVVHGGDRFTEVTALDDTAIDEIDALTPLAPLHQPQALRFIRALRHLKPHLSQTASFAIPRALHDEGIKRYGFHGLSYRFIAGEVSRKLSGKPKIVAAHLGSGASLCALEKGVSRDCSMGFSTLDGIPMATRPGWLDPGAILYLLQRRKQSADQVEDMLYHRSGLLGVSGINADTRHLLEDSRREAREALDLFTLRIAGEIGRMSMTLGGLDAIVFTAGIGEHQPKIRASVLQRLNWLGLAVDENANAANGFAITTPASRIAAHVIATDEEQVIAQEALPVLRSW